MLTTTQSSLELLEAVVQREGATATTLAKELDLAHSTVHKHLNTLLEYGYLSKEENTYYAGAKFCHIADYVRRRKPEYVIAGDIVDELADETKLEADFAVEENGHVISLHNELMFSDSSHFLNVGRFFNVHSTASGKAILAEYSRDHVERIIEKWGLPKKTKNTLCSREELFDELELVRERGYAINDEEAIEGMWAVAKVVKNPIDNVCGSLNLSAPTYFHDPNVRQSAVEALEEKVKVFEERIEEQFKENYGEL